MTGGVASPDGVSQGAFGGSTASGSLALGLSLPLGCSLPFFCGCAPRSGRPAKAAVPPMNARRDKSKLVPSFVMPLFKHFAARALSPECHNLT